uniref:Uncharacterized protein n=1 Tax=Meleagris gallopavo TaxID=9103 RepID=G1MVV2_MELGA
QVSGAGRAGRAGGRRLTAFAPCVPFVPQVPADPAEGVLRGVPQEEAEPLQLHRWVNLPHIHNHLDGHAVAVTESYVYVAGSMEPGFAKTVERYNPNRNIWEQVSNLITRKHSFGLTEVKGNLYSIGGHGNFSPGFKDVAVYNPEQDKWHNLESAPKILRDVKAVSVEDRFVYVAARTPVDSDSEDGLRAVIIRYDAETRQWQDVESLPLIDNYCSFQMSVANTNFYHTASCCPKRAAICYYKDDVFIIGGWKNSDDIDKQYRKEAYRYCAERKRWMLLPPMPQPRCRATACHVRIPFRCLQEAVECICEWLISRTSDAC